MKQKEYAWKKVMSGKEVAKLLEVMVGFLMIQEGSHMKYIKEGYPVSVPNHKTIKKGTFLNIIKRVNFVESKIKSK